MRTVLVVASEARELSGIAGRCRGLERAGWNVEYARVGEMAGMRMALVANGPGPELAGRAAAVPANPDAMVSTGFCGALDPACVPGEVFVATSVNGVCCSAPCTSRPYRSGPLASVPEVVATSARKRDLAASAAAVEMEAAAVGEAARRRGVPFYCIRAVLDAAHESFALDFNSLRDSSGRFSRARIVAAALRRPLAGVPELIRLQQRGRNCSRALGEFIGDCRF